MSDTSAEAEQTDAKSSKIPIILGICLMLAGAAGGFFLAGSGLLTGEESTQEEAAKTEVSALPDVAYVPIDPLVVSLKSDRHVRHLRFAAQLEVNAAYEADVATLLPRIHDVLNGYLRALQVSDIEDPFALTRLRAQMLRRIQVVVGEGRVRDVLIAEFVLN